MKIIGIILGLFIFHSSAVNASDQYNEGFPTSVNLKGNIVLRSNFDIHQKDVYDMEDLYREVRIKFRKFAKLDISKCDSSKLEIRIISKNDLSDRKYFPNEKAYADAPEKYGKGMFVLGRYFRHNNHLYLAPRYNHVYWKVNVAHELAHHFFDQCNVHFASSNAEHEVIQKFERLF